MAKNNKEWLIKMFSLLLISSMILGGCATSATNISQSSSSSDNLTNNQAQTAIAKDKNSNKEMSNNLPQLEGMAKVEFQVNGSPIIMEINGKEAPTTAGNFVDLVSQGVYDGLVFHRVIPGFVAQGGDPQGKDPNFRGQLGTGGFTDPATGSERRIPLEIKLEGEDKPTYSKAKLSGSDVVLKHDRGAIAMARSQMPDSASSQFYIALEDLPSLDGDYAVFGKVVEGMDVVDKIKQGDRITSAKVIEGMENLKK
ncbi:peptidylprolyl isomerase [Pleurocapsa sp. FMAR1]|uniref:peptidylprolyl isomerase n=1 Tax=Pleurocapsa sp. FMAR1 TaxID=3040204 RepID=UPI0029C97B85|nr:peptidylprolyl isomerase [Pleurocapsa sp. FMAR1]